MLSHSFKALAISNLWVWWSSPPSLWIVSFGAKGSAGCESSNCSYTLKETNKRKRSLTIWEQTFFIRASAPVSTSILTTSSLFWKQFTASLWVTSRRLVPLTSRILSPTCNVPSWPAAPLLLIVVTKIPGSVPTCMLSIPPRILKPSPETDVECLSQSAAHTCCPFT